MRVTLQSCRKATKPILHVSHSLRAADGTVGLAVQVPRATALTYAIV